MAYTSPETIDMSSAVGLFQWLNEVTYSWFSNLIVVGFYLILIIVYNRAKDDLAGAFAVAGFGAFVVALLLFLSDFVSGITLGIWIALAIIGFCAVAFDKPRGYA